MADDHEATALTYLDRIVCMTDAHVRMLYIGSDGDAHDPWVSALAEACRERNIDI